MTSVMQISSCRIITNTVSEVTSDLFCYSFHQPLTTPIRKHRPPWTLLENCFRIAGPHHAVQWGLPGQLMVFKVLANTKHRTCTSGKAMIPTGYVINHHSSGWVADVTGDEAAETFLSGCIPELQPNLWPATESMWWREGGISWPGQKMEGKQQQKNNDGN